MPTRLKITTYTVRASQEQGQRWGRVAHWLGFRSVGMWLAYLAEQHSIEFDKLLRLDDN